MGADRAPIARTITCVGSVKWQESRPFDSHDLSGLILHRSKLPGADDTTPLLAISRSGVAVDGVLPVTAEDLLAAWPG